MIMTGSLFKSEAEFEKALINTLKNKGWKGDVFYRPTEKDLIENWNKIIFENNRDVLHGVPLSDSEMDQILKQVDSSPLPLDKNLFINGSSMSILRDNPEAPQLSEYVSLVIFDHNQIAGGRSRYQIAEQPIFEGDVSKKERGDIMLLINGMPVIHIELKANSIDIHDAKNQIQRYLRHGIFSKGIFSLVQFFVAMNPNEMSYFAHPGSKPINPKFVFHWADEKNNIVSDWRKIAEDFLSIPMAHKMVGFFTVADRGDNILKVMRSYQYYAADGISHRYYEEEKKNEVYVDNYRKGGFVWHTTGSGKTMTSFKAAQLIASSGKVDKVVFLVDRIELGTQSHTAYNNMSLVDDSVDTVDSTAELIAKLKDKGTGSNGLIVTSIQKMSRIKEGGTISLPDLEKLQKKEIVFIIDECHRSVFGDMLQDIRNNFPKATYFGFTGTPITETNKKVGATTSDIFGDTIHIYTLAEAIRDKNVLGFQIDRVSTFQEQELRQQVAMRAADAKDEKDLIEDKKKKDVFDEVMALPMGESVNGEGKIIKGIESFIPDAQYKQEKHRNIVVKNILDDFPKLTHPFGTEKQFHAIFATSSIEDAIAYWDLFQKEIDKRRQGNPNYEALKITALFDPSIDNSDGDQDINHSKLDKTQWVDKIHAKYNEDFGLSLQRDSDFKRDIAERLSHKENYRGIDKDRSKQLDILIVVDQMLTGFDSQWVNALFLDKMLQYEGLIQAFSRTNRLLDDDKDFGRIRYYRKPFTMDNRVAEAVKLYTNGHSAGIFADKLEKNLFDLNEILKKIVNIFAAAGIEDFSKVPPAEEDKNKFIKEMSQLMSVIRLATVQGYRLEKQDYTFKDDGEARGVHIGLTKTLYEVLLLRLKEALAGTISDPITRPEESPLESIDGQLNINSLKIDLDYIESRFKVFLKAVQDKDPEDHQESLLNEIHGHYCLLSREQQAAADYLLAKIKSGEIVVQGNETLENLLEKYLKDQKEEQIDQFVEITGVDKKQLVDFINSSVTDGNLNAYGRFDSLKKTIDKEKVMKFMRECAVGVSVSPVIAQIRFSRLLEDFIRKGPVSIELVRLWARKLMERKQQ